jgi:glycosyltransferase involved in cell wall biosynthesis
MTVVPTLAGATGDSGSVPRVSVVMAVHNDAAHLPVAVASILRQSLRELELIVINDGSTDGSGDLLDDIARVDPRLRVLHQENAGLTASLVRGCALARSAVIARQDSDDFSHPQRLEEQLRLLEGDARIGFVSCFTTYVGPDDEPLIEVERDPDPERATHSLLFERQGPPAHGSVMFRKDLYEKVGGYRIPFRFAQDSDLWLRMAEHALIGYVPEFRYRYRRGLGGASGARRPLQKRLGILGHECRLARMEARSEDPILEEARKLSEATGTDAREDRSARADAAYWLGSVLVRNRDRRARRYLLQAVKARPAHFRAWAQLLQSILTAKSP